MNYPFETEGDYIEQVKLEKMDLAAGSVNLRMDVEDKYYYENMSELTGVEIHGEYQLISMVKELAEMKKEYEKVEDAMNSVKMKGYGVVNPGLSDITLEEPVLIKHGNKYGVKMKAVSPSIHMIKANIETEVAPIVGSEEQANDLIAYIKDSQNTEEGVWSTNIFGKSIGELMEDGIRSKISMMDDESQLKLQDTMQKIVNDKIFESMNVTVKEMPIEEAKKLGAMALFGEKYGDHVRVIQFGSSVEFCGGTHVAATGNIGMVKIISESSVAAGVRRIEAYTGARVEELLNTIEDTLHDLKALFNNAPDLAGTIRKYIDENAGLKKQVEDFMKEKEAQLKERLLKNIQEIHGIKVIKFCAPLPAEVVKNIAFQLRGEITENLFFVAGSLDNGKPMLTVMLSDNLVAGGLKAGNLVKEAAKLIQGGGGGQPHFATAGGKNTDGLNAAIEKVLELAGI